MSSETWLPDTTGRHLATERVSDHWVGRESWEPGVIRPNHVPMASPAQLHCELTRFLRQHCPARDQRHLVLLVWMVAGLLLSETVCFDHWKTRLPLGHCLAASWQRRCQRWLANARIDPESLYGPLILWAIQGWQNPGQVMHLALDISMLWNRYCMVVVSVVCHGRAIPLLWQTLEHPSVA